MTVTEARDNRVLKLADAMRNAADELIEFIGDYGQPSITLAAKLRRTITEYDAAMSDADQEEEDRIAAYMSNVLENDPVTADDVCRACSGTGESRQGGSICWRCKGEGVCS